MVVEITVCGVPRDDLRRGLNFQVVGHLRAGYHDFMAKDALQQRKHRFDQLERLKKLLDENKRAIGDALWHDLHKVRGVPHPARPFFSTLRT